MLRALRLAEDNLDEAWSQKQRRGVDCNNPKGFSQKAHCAGRKARQAGRKTKSKPISEAKQLELSTVPMIKKFLPLVKKELKLDKLPKIKIRNHVTVHDGQATFGRFVNDEQTIYLGIADRHPVDVLRTLAHELVHYKQFLDGRIDHKSGETGSPIENEAHAVAGVIMRHFNKKYPNAIKLDDIELMENQKKNLKLENTDFVAGHISYNNKLNPIAWDNSTLKPEIRNRLLKIAKIFVEYLEVPNFKIDDIVLTGSMANFNWTKYSDFDLHIVTDYNNLQCDDIAEVFYRAKKELWNNKHNITIGGHEVELYVEDSANPPVSVGIYSLLNDTWIKKPSYNKPELDNTAINKKVEDLVKQIKQAIASHDVDDIARLKDKLRRMRRSGLDRNGEFSVENLSYKILRNLGLLEKLSDVQKNKLDNELSIKEEQTSGKKLVIFDIDDTLVHTQTQVKVIKDGKVVKSLNSHEFTHYKLQPGEEFDFGAFRDAKEFFLNSKPIIPMINQLKYDIRTGNKVVMVTARADFNDKELFLDTFRKFGIDMSKVHVYRAGNITDKIPTEEKKKLIIRKLLNSDQYDKAIMYDDALPNLESFVSLKNEYPNTKFYAWHVSLEGEASEYRRTNENVLEDQDSNLKSVALAKQNIKAILNAAQNVYDKWDESEVDTYAGGGICHIIADAICDVMSSIGVDATPVSCSYEQHVYVAAKFAEGVYTIDIPYHIYETGGGFSWKKLPDVEFDQRDIVFYRVSSDPEEFDNFTALEEGELIPWPKGTVKVDVSDVYDWYKLGQHISNLKGLGKHDFGKGPPQTVMAFGSEPLEHEYIKDLNKIGLKTYDIDENAEQKPKYVYRIDSEHIKDFEKSLKTYYHNKDFTISGRKDFEDSVDEIKGVYAADLLFTALYSTGSSEGDHKTRYVAIYGPGQPVVYFSNKDRDRIKNNISWLTVFDADNFFKLPSGEYFSEKPGAPVKQFKITDPFAYIKKRGWRIEFVEDLKQILKLVVKKSKINQNLKFGAEGMGYMSIDESMDQGVAEGLDNIPAILYHATYRPLLKSIKKYGLGGDRAQAKWEDSRPGVVYLALDKDVAESYAESSDGVPEEWLDEIVILKISTNGLDKNKFGIDRNVQDNTGDTIEYTGIIPVSNISLVKQGVAENNLTEFAPSQDRQVEENFADGKNPGRKGLAKRVGVPTKASVSRLRQIAKSSSGEKQRMAHWMANMKAGKRK